MDRPDMSGSIPFGGGGGGGTGGFGGVGGGYEGGGFSGRTDSDKYRSDVDQTGRKERGPTHSAGAPTVHASPDAGQGVGAAAATARSERRFVEIRCFVRADAVREIGEAVRETTGVHTRIEHRPVRRDDEAGDFVADGDVWTSVP